MSKKIDLLIISVPTFEINKEEQEQIRKASPEISLTIVKGKEVTPDMIEKAEIIYGWPREDQLKLAKNLKWLQLPSAGADGYTEKENYYNQDIRLTNSSGVYGIPIAEHAFGMILSYNRHLQEYAYNKAAKKWNRRYDPKDFYGSTVGIIGLGDLGREIAKRAKAFGATVLAVKRTVTKAPEYVDHLYPLEEIEEVLTRADYLVLTLPITPKTQGMITEDRLRLMKPDALLVNVGRGAVIDQEALIKALSEGWIGGAALDVTEPEPLPEDSPLWELPNVILTPHASGFSPSNAQRKFEIFYKNLICYLENRPLQNQIDFVEGY